MNLAQWIRLQNAHDDLVGASAAVYARVANLAEEAFGLGLASSADVLHRAAAEILLARFEDPLCSTGTPDEGPVVEVFLRVFATRWFSAVDAEHHAAIHRAPSDPDDYTAWLTELVSRADCTAAHPIFDIVEGSATRDQLSAYLQAENLCDLFFADMLSLLLPGLRGEPKLEIAENFWDEIGHGVEARIHRNMRLDMMTRVGLDASPSAWQDLDRFPREELEHFNAYCITSQYRTFAPRLVGMLLATEVLVPQQLERTIAGWRRVGATDQDLEYMLEHAVTDVAHGDGWIERVVRPVLRARPNVGPDIAAGALHHLAVLTRLYDALLRSFTDDGGSGKAEPVVS